MPKLRRCEGTVERDHRLAEELRNNVKVSLRDRHGRVAEQELGRPRVVVPGDDPGGEGVPELVPADPTHAELVADPVEELQGGLVPEVPAIGAGEHEILGSSAPGNLGSYGGTNEVGFGESHWGGEFYWTYVGGTVDLCKSGAGGESNRTPSVQSANEIN